MTNNVSFLISLQIDSSDRLLNLDISIDNIKYHFPNSEIIISELDTHSKIKNRYPTCIHVFTQTKDFFNRQRGINIAASKASNEIISLYDADIILRKSAITKAIKLIVDGVVDIVYPYNGYFYDVPKFFHDAIFVSKTIDSIDIKDCKLLSDRSVGGVVFYKKECFLTGGGANENFKGLGYEDNELFERFKMLDFNIGRINAPLFHLTHERKNTSFDHNPFNSENLKELRRICGMSKRCLMDEIKTWPHVIQNLTNI